MPAFTDQTGNEIILEDYPKRIISTVPSQTELLFDLGLANEIAGITKFCIHPPEALKTKTIIGGTKNLSLGKIRSLNPHLILANKEENLRTEIETLAKEFPVWVSDIKTLDDALSMINAVGELTSTISHANFISEKISSEFAQLSTLHFELQTKRSIYLIWHNPMMTVGSDTFIHHMLERCGFQNVFAYKKRYPEISLHELAETNPEIIFLSSEPFPFRYKHIAHYQSICPSAKIILVDGQMFSWYGSRLQYAAGYFLRLTNSLNN